MEVVVVVAVVEVVVVVAVVEVVVVVAVVELVVVAVVVIDVVVAVVVTVADGSSTVVPTPKAIVEGSVFYLFALHFNSGGASLPFHWRGGLDATGQRGPSYEL